MKYLVRDVNILKPAVMKINYIGDGRSEMELKVRCKILAARRGAFAARGDIVAARYEIFDTRCEYNIRKVLLKYWRRPLRM